jgi:quercetin dioxygenase-like cupin family protein
MKRERIEELAVSYSTGELEGQELAEFKAWRLTAAPEELAWFAAIVDGAGELAMSHLRPVAPSPELKGKIMAQLGLDDEASTSVDPDFSFLSQAQEEGEWIDLPEPGVRIRPLSDHEEDGHTIFILELDPNTTFPAHRHQGAESAYVLSGDLEIEGRFLRAGDFSRAAPGSHHRSLYSRDGCRALIVTSYANFHDN